SFFLFFFLFLLLPPVFTLFPYTTLFRSLRYAACCNAGHGLDRGAHQPPGLASLLPPRVFPLQARKLVNRRPGFPGDLPYKAADRSEEHTSELQSRFDLVCRLLLEKKKKK